MESLSRCRTAFLVMRYAPDPAGRVPFPSGLRLLAELHRLAARWGDNVPVSFLVEDNPAKHRFEILVDDALAGFTAYLPRGEVRVFTHTEVRPEYQDMGVGAALVRGTLDQVRQEGGRLVPQCPFVRAYIDRHPEYADLVAASV